MNSVLSTSTMMTINNSIATTIESWFIPFDILIIMCNSSVIVLTTLFLFTIISDKVCHTIPMMLVANSCLAELMLAGDVFWMSIFTLQNDIKQIQYQDTFCVFRGYLSYTLCALHNYSYLLEAFYRYKIIMYPTRLFWQLPQTQLLLICLTCIFAFVFPIPFIFTNEIIYNVDNQICQLPFRLSFSICFVACCVFFIPMFTTIFIYKKLVQYVREISKRVTPANILPRAERELKMVRRLVLLIIILFVIISPYALFIFISFFTTPPKYHLRIACIFINISLAAVTIALFQFTDTLKSSVKKILYNRPNIVIPTLE